METGQSLVQRCLDGDPLAWEALVQTYQKRIYNLAYRFSRRTHRAEELTQEAFLKIFQNLGSYRPEAGSFERWLLRVSRNAIIDQQRRVVRHQNQAGSDALEALQIADPSRLPADEEMHRRERFRRILEVLGSLPAELQQAVILRDLEEMTYHEVALLLGIPEGTVKSRINRGRIEMARRLARAPGGHPGGGARDEAVGSPQEFSRERAAGGDLTRRRR